MLEPSHADLSVRQQCRLLGVARSGLYYEPQGESPQESRPHAAHRRGLHPVALAPSPRGDPGFVGES